MSATGKADVPAKLSPCWIYVGLGSITIDESRTDSIDGSHLQENTGGLLLFIDDSTAHHDVAYTIKITHIALISKSVFFKLDDRLT
jgi:hypothetical protein